MGRPENRAFFVHGSRTFDTVVRVFCKKAKDNPFFTAANILLKFI